MTLEPARDEWRPLQPDERLRLLEADAERSRRVLDAVYNISLACRGATAFREIFEAAYHELHPLFHSDACTIAVYEPAASSGQFRAALFAAGQATRYAECIPDDPLTAAVAAGHKPHLLADLAAAPVAGTELPRIGCWLGVSVRTADKWRGVITIYSQTPHAYNEQDAVALQRLANVAAVALENAFLDQQQRQLRSALADQVAARSVELATLSALAAELVLRQSLPTLLDRALDMIVPLFGLEGGTVRLLDARRELLRVVAHLGFAPQVIGGAIDLPLAGSTSGLVVRQNRPIAVPRGMRDLASPVVPRPYPFDAMLTVPLRSGERVLGTLSLHSIRPRDFTQEEIDLAQALGNQIAIAVENSALFVEQERQIHELDAIGRVGKLISASFDFEEMLDGVYHALQGVTSAPVFFLVICDPASQVVTNAIFIEQDERVPLDWLGRVPARGTLTAWILNERQPLLFSDVAEQRAQLAARGIVPRPLGPENLVRAWVGVPLLARNNEAIGVLSLQDYQSHCYDEQTVAFLEQVASHISLGVQKLRLYAENVTRVERELSIAREIQSNLFPHSLPALPGLLLDARCIPARETGGDFYDFVALDGPDNASPALGIVVGDVSGKSIPAAMLMAVARSIARSEARDHRTPQAMVRETNTLVAQDVPPRAFVALSYATLDLQQRKLALSNAGQLAPLHRRADGSVTYLEPPGPTLPLGILPATAYEALELTLDPGDLLVFVTDGIVEARNAAGLLFGFERLEAILVEQGQLHPVELIDVVLAAVAAFMDGAPQHDDMTIVALRLS